MMRNYCILLVALLSVNLSAAQIRADQKQKEITPQNPNYNKVLAQKLGADDYGMKGYFLVILKTGTNSSQDKDFIKKSFAGHMDNMEKLVQQGTLIIAGPIGKNENNYRGIFILNNISSMEAAKELLQTDPAIQAGLLSFDIYKWYGSAALAEYLPASEKVWKLKP